MSVDASTTDADYAFGENGCTDRRNVRVEKTKHQKTNDVTEVKPVWSCVYTTSTPILRPTQSRCFATCKNPEGCCVAKSRHAALGPWEKEVLRGSSCSWGSQLPARLFLHVGSQEMADDNNKTNRIAKAVTRCPVHLHVCHSHLGNNNIILLTQKFCRLCTEHVRACGW